MDVKILRIYMVVMLVFALFLLLALGIIEGLPFFSGNDDFRILQQANLQLVRDEFMVKDLLILTYRPVSSHPQAVGELQIVLPTFQQTQNGLLNGDTSLGLPPNPSPAVRTAIGVTQSDYLSMVTAMKIILAHPDSAPDPIQVQIILQHERPYVTNMYQVVVLLTQEAEARKLQLFLVKSGLIVLVAFIVLLKYFLLTQRAVGKLAREEEKKNVQDNS